MIHIAVIIPFYQRVPGLLATAVQSVLDQNCADSVRLSIIVVDDASPTPPEPALDTLSIPAPHRVRLIKQANAGPGAARNAGLTEAAREQADFVAFLDSDDRWFPDHLGTALDTLGEDADFFFDDHVRAQYPGESYMQTSGRLERWCAAGVIEPIGGDRYRIRADDALGPFLNDCLAQTSTIVFRRGAFAGIRFDPALRSLGEDLLVMLQLAQGAREIRLSSRVGVYCDEGVSIFHSALSWDHPDAPMRFAGSLLLWTTIARQVPLNPRDRKLVDDRIAGFRRGFAYIWLRSAWRSRAPHRASIALLRRTIGWRPRAMIPALLGVGYRKLLRQTAFPEH